MDSLLQQWFFWHSLKSYAPALDLYVLSLTSASSKLFFREHILPQCQFDVERIVSQRAWSVLNLIMPHNIGTTRHLCRTEYLGVIPQETTPADWAARKGCLPLLCWMVNVAKVPCTSLAMDFAARNGYMDVVSWLHARQVKCTNAASDWAAMKGHVDVLEWLYANTNARCSELAAMVAAGKGDLATLKWLYAHKASFTDASINWACACNHPETIEWLESVLGMSRPTGNLDAYRKAAVANLKSCPEWD